MRILAILLFVVFAFSGCAERETIASKAASDNILLIGNGDEPSSLDPHLATTISEAHILYGLFEGLVSPNSQDPSDVEPGVASNWKYNSEQNTYRFFLRTDAKWSDGENVTAQHFVESARRALSPKLRAAYPEMFFDIERAEAYYGGKIDSFASVGIRAINTNILEIKLSRPAPNFLQKLKHFSWLPVPIHSIQKMGPIEDRSIYWATGEHIVSNGPFRLSSWTANSLIEIEKNPYYWDNDNISLNKIRFFPYEDAQLEYRAFNSGQLHVTDKIPIERIGNPADEHHQRSDPFLATSYLLFNTDSPKLANQKLRQALALAIDKESLAIDINRSGKAAKAFTPQGLSNYPQPQAAEYNPAKASELIARTYPQVDSLPKLRFLVSNNPSSRAIAEAIQAMWMENLRLEVTLINMEAKSLFASLNSGDYEISYLSWTGDYEDPIAFLEIWESSNTKNRARWKNASYDKLLQTSQRESDPTKRLVSLARAESILIEDSPIVPILWKTKNYAISDKVSDWQPSLLDTRNYKQVSLSQ